MGVLIFNCNNCNTATQKEKQWGMSYLCSVVHKGLTAALSTANLVT